MNRVITELLRMGAPDRRATLRNLRRMVEEAAHMPDDAVAYFDGSSSGQVWFVIRSRVETETDAPPVLPTLEDEAWEEARKHAGNGRYGETLSERVHGDLPHPQQVVMNGDGTVSVGDLTWEKGSEELPPVTYGGGYHVEFPIEIVHVTDAEPVVVDARGQKFRATYRGGGSPLTNLADREKSVRLTELEDQLALVKNAVYDALNPAEDEGDVIFTRGYRALGARIRTIMGWS